MSKSKFLEDARGDKSLKRLIAILSFALGTAGEIYLFIASAMNLPMDIENIRTMKELIRNSYTLSGTLGAFGVAERFKFSNK